MIHLIVGLLAMAAFMILYNLALKKGVVMTWWQYLLSGFEIIFLILVSETIITFLSEGKVRAALIMGGGLALFAVIGAILLIRNLFKQPQAAN